MKDYPRLIEHAFPLRQTSIDSVHEKNVRHGHISTLHIWPARRPLAASRAALLATLLADPGSPEERRKLCEEIGGKIVEEKDKDGRVREATDGGILRWKRESENAAILSSLREKVLIANGGRPPKVLDPFAGGGAIPLEAMRLGCEVTAADLNPVAWFVLKCTLEHSQKLSGKHPRLPDFALRDLVFMQEFFSKGIGLKGPKLRQAMRALGFEDNGSHYQPEVDLGDLNTISSLPLDADISWHVRAWGRRVLGEARRDLAKLYPTYAEWMPLVHGQPFEPTDMRLVEPNDAGVPDVAKMNTDLSDEYLANGRNPRWVAKPTVAYLWARSVRCKSCRATLPLLKTRWLCKKDGKRVLLTLKPNANRDGVDFGIEHNVPERGGNSAQRREHDKILGAGTMSRSGAKCPCCDMIMKTEDVRYEGTNGRIGQTITTVVVDGLTGKEYRCPTTHELTVSNVADDFVDNVFSDVPFGLTTEPTPKCGPGASRAFSVDQYGFDQWRKLFTNRQLCSLGTLVKAIRHQEQELRECYKSDDFVKGVTALLVCGFDRLLDFASNQISWITSVEAIGHNFVRYALPITWDFSEGAIISDGRGGWDMCLGAILEAFETASSAASGAIAPRILNQSVLALGDSEKFDVIITDPPYYDAIPYSDLMDYFYVWLRRSLHGTSPDIDCVFSERLSPKWNHETSNGELIDDASRHGGDKGASKKAYEDGMAKAFQVCHKALSDCGRFVVVFAHKHPDAWETLVSAIIRAGFVVDGSWPIQTEQAARMRAQSSAALASSVWLICRKRDALAKVGWDNRVLAEMRENIGAQLREFWDAGIRGPDFVWAATGPAMEAYSKYPAVKKANSPTGEFLSVSEFLDAVRRIVIEFVVGRVLHIDAGTDRLDPVTSYYLLHRSDFAFQKAPAGACILYAVSCGLSDAELERTWGLIKVKGSVSKGEENEDGEDSSEEVSGGEFVLKTWRERSDKRIGYESVGGRDVPLIDRVHRLMHLWRDGDVRKVDDYLDEHALRRNELFLRLIQSLIEVSRNEKSTEECSLLESLSNHLGSKAAKAERTRSLGIEYND